MNDTADDTFTALFHRHKNHVYDFAVAMLGDRDAAGDIVQEAFIRLYRHVVSGTEIAKPINWLLVVVRNLCLNRIRDLRNQVTINDQQSLPDGASDTGSSHSMLESALTSLHADFREALILREYQRLSYSEIAEILDLTVPAVRSLLYRARNGLREAYFKLTEERKEL